MGRHHEELLFAAQDKRIEETSSGRRYLDTKYVRSGPDTGCHATE
jgi:hypothetical protein